MLSSQALAAISTPSAPRIRPEALLIRFSTLTFSFERRAATLPLTISYHVTEAQITPAIIVEAAVGAGAATVGSTAARSAGVSGLSTAQATALQ